MSSFRVLPIAALLTVAAWSAPLLSVHAATDAASSRAVAVAARTQPGIQHYRLGALQITALSDGSVPQDLHALLQGTTPAQTDALLRQSFRANPVEVSINAYLLTLGDRQVLIETGAGQLFGPGAGGKLVERLAALGIAPEAITDVLLTHIHADHSGGLTRDGAPTFPNATVHVGQADLDYFLAPEHQQGVKGYDASYFTQATASLAPYLARGQVRGFRGETTILPGITALPAPGHTPGHAFYRVQSEGESLTFIGDLLHVQSVQMPRPDITIAYDVDPAAARATRERYLTEFAQTRATVAGAHLAFPGIGHVRQQGKGFGFVPVDHEDRNPD